MNLSKLNKILFKIFGAILLINLVFALLIGGCFEATPESAPEKSMANCQQWIEYTIRFSEISNTMRLRAIISMRQPGGYVSSQAEDVFWDFPGFDPMSQVSLDLYSHTERVESSGKCLPKTLLIYWKDAPWGNITRHEPQCLAGFCGTDLDKQNSFIIK